MTPLARRLKEATAASHHQVEAALDLLGMDGWEPARCTRRLGDVLLALHGFWVTAEAGVDAWARRHPGEATAVQWSRRRRGDLIRADLTALGFSTGSGLSTGSGFPTGSASVGADTATTAGVLGWLYVAEGSTLGGAVIDRTLHRQGVDVALRSFRPYAEGPGPMWQAYHEYLARWCLDDEARTVAVLDAARGAFAGLADWLAPLSLRAAG